MYRKAVQQLIAECRAVPVEAREQALAEKIAALLAGLDPNDFLAWAREDREYSYFYFDLQQRGACAKPAEAAWAIIDEIARDALSEDAGW